MLANYKVRYVLIGSVAAALYGIDACPGDLDITPAPDRENLVRLAACLEATEAKPSADIGHWDIQPNGERKWFRANLTPEEIERFRASWVPKLDKLSSFDYLFVSRYGNFDVVPELVGTFEDLRERAVALNAFDYDVWVANVDDLLATLTVPRRAKDGVRVTQLREVQRTQRRTVL